MTREAPRRRRSSSSSSTSSSPGASPPPAALDFYYTLTSVALLSIASAGVWLTFYIGRINIGQGAYALVGGYVSAILVTTYGWSFWWTLPPPASSAPS